MGRPKDLSSVNIALRSSVSGGTIADLPFNNNETGQNDGTGIFSWEVGKLSNGAQLPPGSTYELILEGDYSARDRAKGRSSVKDFTDGLITLVLCQG